MRAEHHSFVILPDLSLCQAAEILIEEIRVLPGETVPKNVPAGRKREEVQEPLRVRTRRFSSSVQFSTTLSRPEPASSLIITNRWPSGETS